MFLLNNSVHKVYTNLKLNLGQVIFANSTVLLVKEPNTINSLICWPLSTNNLLNWNKSVGYNHYTHKTTKTTEEIVAGLQVEFLCELRFNSHYCNKFPLE